MRWGFDHFVVRCRDVEASLEFYTAVLGFPPERIEQWRAGDISFPSVRVSPSMVIDLFPAAADADREETRQAVDHVCLTADRASFESLQGRLEKAGVVLVDGPVERWGAQGIATSIYFKDPDDLTIEVRTYED
jgi:catechol 2,3-dioxygenase-like lactoylglutathione lyase family enzyme